MDTTKLFEIFPEYQLPEREKKVFLAERTACILGRPLAERLGLKVGDRVTIEGDTFPVTLDPRVRGIYDSARFHCGWARLAGSSRRGRRRSGRFRRP